MKAKAMNVYCETVNVKRYRAGAWSDAEDLVLIEVPVALIYNGFPHVVVMCTPKDIVDFVYGFSLSEGIVTSLQDVRSIDITPKELGVEVKVEVSAMCAARIEGRKRQMSARTGCGICGLDSLSGVVRDQSFIDYDFEINEEAIDFVLKKAESFQLMNQATGGAHAAFFVSKDGEILITREDVGRHVAIDKVVGAMLQMQVNPKNGFILTTSRASFEMVQKSVAAGVGLLVTMSAPTTMAIALAKKMNIKLAAFSRVGKINLYQG